MKHIPTTATAVEKIKRAAKAMSKTQSQRLAPCLDHIARTNGYEHWQHVTACRQQTTRTQQGTVQ